jgi:hypothetical protein
MVIWYVLAMAVTGISYAGYQHGGWAGVFGVWELLFAIVGVMATVEVIRSQMRWHRQRKR